MIMRLLVAVLLFFSLRCFGATEWPIIGAEVETNGWVLRLTLSTSPDLGSANANTNGGFFNGFGTNNSPSYTNSLVLTLVSMGYDDSGGGIRVGRQVYGTKLLRLPYPLQNTNHVVAENTTNCLLRIALSDFVYIADSNITVSALVGYFATTNGTTRTNAAALTAVSVTNSSVMIYPKAIANWSYPGFNLITGNTMTTRAVGFHGSGQQGRPLRVMRFVASDLHGNSVTNFQTTMTPTRDPLTGICVSEYVGRLDISGMTNGDDIKCDFTAYPWVGTNTCDTFDGVNKRGPYYASITNVCDRLGAYGRSYAIVATNGVDANGVVSSNSSTSWQTPFLTIRNAMNAICKSNAIWFTQSRSNSANSTIYLVTGGHNWFADGNDTAFGDPYPSCWLTIAPYPTNAGILTASITNASFGNPKHNKRIKLSNIYVNNMGNVYGLYGEHSAFWIDGCLISDLPGSFNGASPTNLFITSTTFSNCTTFENASVQLSLMRDIADYTTNGFPFEAQTLLSFQRKGSMSFASGANVTAVTTDKAIANVQHLEMPIAAYCDFRGMQGSSQLAIIYDGTACTNGAAIIQNIFEVFSGNNSTFQIVGGTSSAMTNLILWNNIFLGNRSLFGYNDTGSTPLWRTLWSSKNNVFDWRATKSDSFSPGNGARIGNWAICNGVGIVGDVAPGTTNKFSTPVANQEEFAGLGSMVRFLLLTNWFKFSTVQWQQAESMSGMGDYHFKSESPVFLDGLSTSWVLPFDIEGHSRSAIDPPGAYSAGNVKKGF